MGKSDPKYRCVSRMTVLACLSRNLHSVYTNWQTINGDDIVTEAGICTDNYVPRVASTPLDPA